MFHRHYGIVLLLLLCCIDSPRTDGADDKMTVREMLVDDICFAMKPQLIKLGDSAFPEYELILKDKNAKYHEISRILAVLQEIKTDRSRFLELTISHVSSKSFQVRWNAVLLIQQIGSPREASILIALLSDSDSAVQVSAIKAISMIGGPRELIALDALLQGTALPEVDKNKLRERIIDCRDKLKQRLDKEASQKK